MNRRWKLTRGDKQQRANETTSEGAHVDLMKSNSRDDEGFARFRIDKFGSRRFAPDVDENAPGRIEWIVNEAGSFGDGSGGRKFFDGLWDGC